MKIISSSTSITDKYQRQSLVYLNSYFNKILIINR
jgi:hypothetical protein